ncbi:MAG: class A beta-lactamase [Gammaproteobacteria bacterium]|nr:class A beta-lactamase [Gammaproteobacteria bacterium]MDH4255924.1 class A beta-lactamase [Gammaproteobacteria bacterium]MDH5311273.1 class A beta-lactamase [Gammaproteobacteria bacterium]
MPGKSAYRWSFIGCAALLLAGCVDPASEARETFAAELGALEQEVGGTIGVYALDTGSGRELAWRADERFSMASTFKALLAAAALAEVDADRLGLDEPLELAGVPLVTYSPVVEKYLESGSITIAELCEAAVTLSDNTAANLLLGRVGGPEGLTAFLRRHGDGVTRLDRWEPELNENAAGDERDTTTPRAFAKSLERMLFTDVLSETSRRRLADWLVANKTGDGRLRAGLPDGWRVGDKTGTGANAAVNDVGVAWPPGRAPILIAVYMSWSDAEVATLNAMHAEIAALVAEHFR